MEELAFNNYKAFILSADCVREVHGEVGLPQDGLLQLTVCRWQKKRSSWTFYWKSYQLYLPSVKIFALPPVALLSVEQ